MTIALHEVPSMSPMTGIALVMVLIAMVLVAGLAVVCWRTRRRLAGLQRAALESSIPLRGVPTAILGGLLLITGSCIGMVGALAAPVVYLAYGIDLGLLVFGLRSDEHLSLLLGSMALVLVVGVWGTWLLADGVCEAWIPRSLSVSGIRRRRQQGQGQGHGPRGIAPR